MSKVNDGDDGGGDVLEGGDTLGGSPQVMEWGNSLGPLSLIRISY